MAVSKSQKVRHQVLEFLWEKWRSPNTEPFDCEDFAFTISEIAIGLKLDRGLVDEQVAILYRNQEIDAIKTSSGENRFFINEKGFASVASKTILNEGKISSLQPQSKYTSSISHLLTGLTALTTIIIDFTLLAYLKEKNGG